MVILILDGKTALLGAKEGLNLCITAVIPSIFPFLVLSGILTAAFSGSKLSVLSLPARLFHLPKGTEALLVNVFLGGYPVGASAVSREVSRGQLSKEAGEIMLSWSNQAGPAFLFGMLGMLFSSRITLFLIWLIQIISALWTCQMYCGKEWAPAALQCNSALPELRTSVGIMGVICGWIVLMRVVIAFLDRWVLWALPGVLRILVIGILELSNGCAALAQVSGEGPRMLLACVMLSMGGVCVALQTQSVCGGLSMKYYIQGKLIQGCFSAVLCLGYLRLGWSVLLLGIVFPIFMAGIRKKTGSIPGKTVV